MENLQDLYHHLQFLELKTLHCWIHKSKGSDLSHTFFLLMQQFITCVDSMLSEYKALSILMYMEIFLSQIICYMNNVFNTTIDQMHLQPYFHLSWYIQEEIALLFHTCICPTQIFQTYSRKHTHVYKLPWTLKVLYQLYWLCYNQLKGE